MKTTTAQRQMSLQLSRRRPTPVLPHSAREKCIEIIARMLLRLLETESATEIASQEARNESR